MQLPSLLLRLLERLKSYLIRTAAVSGLCLVVACGGSTGGNAPAGPVTVDIFGDSLLRGIGIKTSVVQKLKADNPEWVIGDFTATGLLLRDAVAGYKEPFLNADPIHYPLGPQPAFEAVKRSGRVVVIELGGNDCYTLQTREQFEGDLRKAISVVQAENRIPVLTGVVDLPIAQEGFTEKEVKLCREFNAITHTVAGELGLAHAGWGEDYRGPQDVVDGVHRTQEASDRLTVLLEQAVKRALGI